MGNLFGLIGNLIPITAGIYCIVVYGGHYTPDFKTDQKRERFENIKAKHGGKLVFGGYFIIAFAIFRIATSLF